MKLEWDAGKAALNLKNHGVAFEDAALVFYDHGRIESYDPATQRATVLPMVRHEVPQSDGSSEYEDLPPLPEVPVIQPRGGAFFDFCHWSRGRHPHILPVLAFGQRIQLGQSYDRDF